MSYRRFLTLAAVLLAASINPLSAQMVIMPLGDSITWGYNGSLTDPATPGGYRDPLYNTLTNAGYSVDYTGVNTGNPSTTLTNAGQTGHNGFNGYTIDEITGNLDGSISSADGNSNLGGYWLTGGGTSGRGPAPTPNIILLEIGTNDIGQRYDPLNPSPTVAQFASDMTLRMQTLLNKLITLEPNTLIMVGNVLPFYGSNDYVDTYNADLQNLIVTDYNDAQVQFVNLNGPFNNPGPGENLGYFSDDDVHPNTAGYDLMAQGWADAIETDFPLAESVPEPTTWALLLPSLALLIYATRRSRSNPSS